MLRNAICSMGAQNFNAEPKDNQMHFIQEIKRIRVPQMTYFNIYVFSLYLDNLLDT